MLVFIGRHQSWCPHCMNGNGVASPHGQDTQEDNSIRVEGVQTISVDHCLLGTEQIEEGCGERPLLTMHDGKPESLYCVPVSSKAASEWVMHCVKVLIEEVGHGGMKIGFKSDHAEELISLRKKLAEVRGAETVRIIEPDRVLQAKGAIERAVRT